MKLNYKLVWRGRESVTTMLIHMATSNVNICYSVTSGNCPLKMAQQHAVTYFMDGPLPALL